MSKNLKINILLDFYGQLLTQKQRDIMELYYFEDLSLSEISELKNITRQGVHDCIKRSELILEDYELKLSLADKFSQLGNLFDEIIHNADLICKYSDENNEIYQRSCCIKNIILNARNII